LPFAGGVLKQNKTKQYYFSPDFFVLLAARPIAIAQYIASFPKYFSLMKS